MGIVNAAADAEYYQDNKCNRSDKSVSSLGDALHNSRKHLYGKRVNDQE